MVASQPKAILCHLPDWSVNHKMFGRERGKEITCLLPTEWPTKMSDLKSYTSAIEMNKNAKNKRVLCNRPISLVIVCFSNAINIPFMS